MTSPVKKIMIVDDDYDFRNAVAAILANNGYLVEHYSGRLDVLKSIAREKPDLLLLDLCMTEIGGYEVLKAINRRKLPTQVLVLSGYLNQFDLRLLKTHGAIDFIAKPVEARTLVARVAEALDTGAKGTDASEREQEIALIERHLGN